MQKGFGVIIFILIVFILSVSIVGSVFAIKKYYPSMIPQSNTSKVQNEITNWETYTSTRLGITFKYPSILKANRYGDYNVIKASPSEDNGFNECGVGIKPTEKQPFETYVNIESEFFCTRWANIDQFYNINIGESFNTWSGGAEYIRKQDMTIDSLNAHVYDKKQEYSPSINKLIVIKKNGSYYTINIGYNVGDIIGGIITGKVGYWLQGNFEKDKYLKIFNQILSTFKFTN